MRANSPTDNEFSVLNPVEDEAAIEKVTQEQKELVKASKSKEGKIILDHMQTQVDKQINVLKYTDFTGIDPVVGMVTVMSTQKALHVFEDVLNSVEVSKQAIKDAAKES